MEMVAAEFGCEGSLCLILRAHSELEETTFEIQLTEQRCIRELVQQFGNEREGESVTDGDFV